MKIVLGSVHISANFELHNIHVGQFWISDDLSPKNEEKNHDRTVRLALYDVGYKTDHDGERKFISVTFVINVLAEQSPIT